MRAVTDADLARWEAEAMETMIGRSRTAWLSMIAEIRLLRAELQRRDDEVS